MGLLDGKVVVVTGRRAWHRPRVLYGDRARRRHGGGRRYRRQGCRRRCQGDRRQGRQSAGDQGRRGEFSKLPGDGRESSRRLWSDRRTDQQRGDLHERAGGKRHLAGHHRRSLGPDHGGQRQRLVAVQSGGGAGDAETQTGQRRQHLVEHGLQRRLDDDALCDLEGGGRGLQPCARPRARARTIFASTRWRPARP